MNFPAFSEGERHAGEAEMVKGRQEALGRQGFDIAREVFLGLSRLRAGRAVVEQPDPGSERKNQARFAPAQTDIEGGWHIVQVAQDRKKLMRLTVVHPRGTNPNPEGHVEIELGDEGLRNGKVVADRPSHVRLQVDEENKMRVLGTEAGFRFDVDHPNARSMFADLSAAERVMKDAQAGVTDLLSRMPEPTPPEAPQQ